MADHPVRIDFFIIGAQKSGTKWLWKKLYFYNEGNSLIYDDSLPVIPETISKKYPDVKIFICLRDPVRRAISAYSHWLRQGTVSPHISMRKMIEDNPRFRIIEFGRYEKYISEWMKYIPKERICVLLQEDDIIRRPVETMKKAYQFLDIDDNFAPEETDKVVHKGWGWNRTVLNYHLGPKAGKVLHRWPLRNMLDKFDFFKGGSITRADVDYLRDIYLPEKESLEKLIDRDLSCWSYDYKVS